MMWKSFILAWGFVFLATTTADEPTGTSTKEPERVTLRGRVIEIHRDLDKAYGLDLPSAIEPIYGFRTSTGRLYTLVKTQRSVALFIDKRLHERELIIKGRQFPNTQIVEATFFQSVLQGRVHDLYYYCDICSIKSITPEICSCCREPVRLVEEPTKAKGKATN